MPFTSTDNDIALVRNDATGGFDFDWDTSGNPAYDNRETHRVLTLLAEHRGRWIMDDRGDHGSTLYLVKQDRASTASEIESRAREALQRAVDEGWIANVKAIAQRLKPGSYRLSVTYDTPNTTGNVVQVQV